MRSDLFHDGVSLKPQIWAWLRDLTGHGVIDSTSTQKRSEIYRALLEMFEIDPGKRATARDVADVLKDVESTSLLNNYTCLPVASSSASELIGKIFSWAATVISKEPPLASGNRRVRWKCVCA